MVKLYAECEKVLRVQRLQTPCHYAQYGGAQIACTAGNGERAKCFNWQHLCSTYAGTVVTQRRPRFFTHPAQATQCGEDLVVSLVVSFMFRELLKFGDFAPGFL